MCVKSMRATQQKKARLNALLFGTTSFLFRVAGLFRHRALLQRVGFTLKNTVMVLVKCSWRVGERQVSRPPGGDQCFPVGLIGFIIAYSQYLD